MAKYKSQYFDDANITTAGIGAFLTAAGWQFSVEGSTTTVVLSDNVSLVISNGTVGYNYWDFSIVVGGNTITTKRITRSTTLVSCKSGSMAFLEAYGGYDYLRFTFLYESIGGVDYYGYDTTTSDNYCPISDLTLNNVSTGETTYAHGALLNYAAESGSIDYCDNDALFLSGVKAINDPNFKACSTMTANTVITVQGSNCFVIGAHSLFEYDN